MGIPYTYILEWLEPSKKYIGARWSKNCHPNDLWVHYFTSSKYVKEFVKMYGGPDKIWIDGIFHSIEDAMEREMFLLQQNNVKSNPEFLNKSIQGIWDRDDPDIKHRHATNLRASVTEEQKESLRQRNKLRLWTDEHREKVRKGVLSYQDSEDGQKNNTLFKLGHRHSDIVKKKMSVAATGRKFSKERNAKIVIANTGRKHPKITCPHCGKQGGSTAMPRWHFNNCATLYEKRG